MDGDRQRVVRGTNDRTYNLLWALGALDGSFACECDRLACDEKIVLTSSEFVGFRRREQPICVTGHEDPLRWKSAAPES